MEQHSAFARRRICFLAVVLCLMGLLTAGCGNPEIDLSDYGADTLEIHGLPGSGETVRLQIRDLSELDCVTVKTQSTSDKIGVVRATGPLLETLLASLDIRFDDLEEVTFTALDGYEITLDRSFLQENQVILAFGIDGESLGADEAPLRIVIPGSDSAYWIRMVAAITLTQKP